MLRNVLATSVSLRRTSPLFLPGGALPFPSGSFINFKPLFQWGPLNRIASLSLPGWIWFLDGRKFFFIEHLFQWPQIINALEVWDVTQKANLVRCFGAPEKRRRNGVPGKFNASHGCLNDVILERFA